MEKNPDYIFIHNNDIILDRNALKELVRAAENNRDKGRAKGGSGVGDRKDCENPGDGNGDIGFVTGKVYFYDRPDVLQLVGRKTHPRNLAGRFIGTNEKDTGQYDEPMEYDYCDDVFLLVNPCVIEELGAYDPDFFLMYEITDWCARVRKKGYRIIYTPKARIWHKVSLSHGGTDNPLTRYFLARNRILFMRKNASESIFRNFLLRNLTFDFMSGFVTYTLKHRFDLALALTRGRLSALKWLVSYNR
jgi:GT2 family glycosyltransferase